MGSMWDLLGVLVMSLCMGPLTNHQVYVKILQPIFSKCYLLICLVTSSPVFFSSFRCQRIRLLLHPCGQERWGHLFPCFTQTLQWVASHLCWPADNQRGSPQQEQKTPVRPHDHIALSLLLFAGIITKARWNTHVISYEVRNYCFSCHDFCYVLNYRFVSISKNYRSVIRACMQELQQVAGRKFET